MLIHHKEEVGTARTNTNMREIALSYQHLTADTFTSVCNIFCFEGMITIKSCSRMFSCKFWLELSHACSVQ